MSQARHIFLQEQAPSAAAAAVFSPDHPNGCGGRVVASVIIRVTIKDASVAGRNTMTLSSVATLCKTATGSALKLKENGTKMEADHLAARYHCKLMQDVLGQYT
jgi:hypothetical protein